VPLRTVATIQDSSGPTKVTREDQQRLVQITANVLPGQLGKVTDAIEKTLSEYSFPEGFNYKLGGSAEDMKESFFFLGLAFLASILLVYMVMASVFESLRTPFVIAFTIPLSMTGVGLVLFLTGTSLSVTALIGIVLLVGVVVNNSIVLVDHANQQCDKGLSRKEAVAIAGRMRIRPILMTTLTTVLAMVPMALELGSGSESWSPLARVVIGGMTYATFVTLLVVPVIYRALGGGHTGRIHDEDIKI
jgi:HAE1 family hydrophobic/amphiphilic exporter-1